MRTFKIPVRENRNDVIWDGIRLGGVMSNSLTLPLVWVMYFVIGLEVLGFIFFGAWVFVLTLWGRAFRFAFRIEYVLPEESE